MQAVLSPRVVASSAAPAPVQPPPMMMTSNCSPDLSAFTCSARVFMALGLSPRFTRELKRLIFARDPAVDSPAKSISSGFLRKE